MEPWEQIMKRASMANTHDSDLELSKVLLSACYVALEKIREVLSDASIEDDDCFTISLYPWFVLFFCLQHISRKIAR